MKGFEEVVISVCGQVKLVMLYVSVAKKYVKIFPNNSDNHDFQPEIKVFDEGRAREIIRNYERLHNATVIIQPFKGFRDYSKIKVESNDIKLNNLFNGKKVCITA